MLTDYYTYYTDADTDVYYNTEPYPDRYGYCDLLAISHCNSNSHLHDNGYGNCDPFAYPFFYEHRDCYSDCYRYRNRNGHRDPDCHINCDSNEYANASAYTYTDSNRNVHRNSDKHSNCLSDSNCDCNEHRDGDSNAYVNSNQYSGDPDSNQHGDCDRDCNRNTNRDAK